MIASRTDSRLLGETSFLAGESACLTDAQQLMGFLYVWYKAIRVQRWDFFFFFTLECHVFDTVDLFLTRGPRYENHLTTKVNQCLVEEFIFCSEQKNVSSYESECWFS